ncbi:MAG: hypothetical protein ACHQQ3_14875, partial [Gemmatimonadales bacterium]
MRTANLWLALAALSQSSASTAAVTPARAHERAPADSTRVWALDGTRHLSLIGVNASAAEYRGRKAVRLVETADGPAGGRDRAVAMIDDAEFHDGTIELWVAGSVRPGVADTSVRGFVGLAFRGAADASRYENIYLRPTNGRSSDQVRRNHAVQYESLPDYPWFRLRQESPGKYEAYADLQPGEWTKMKVVVRGAHAELFVNDAAQPSLVVDDLKLGDRRGSVGLWIGPGTEAWFSQLRLSGESGAAPGAPAASRAQTAIPLNAAAWTATDGLKFVEYNGRPSLYIDRGVALARDVALRDGTIEMDMATPRGGNFMGVVFHASSARNSEVVFFRPGQSGTVDAMQYAPALNGVAAAWQMYHGEGANAAPVLA